jgi:nucleotide-binding universal stress UspA family protein
MVKLGHALAAGGATPSQFYALHLIRPTGRASFQLRHSPEPREEPREDAEGALKPLLERARRLALEVRPLSFVSAEPARDICRTAEAKQADLILLGWHKPLFSQTVLGGTVHEVMREADTDVAVLVDRGLGDIHRVLVPFIGSRHDRAALGLARRLVRGVGAEVTVLHVKSPDEAPGQPASRLLDEKLFPEASARVRLEVVTHASPEDAVLAEAGQGYDLVVVGVGPEWGLGERVFGLQRERIIRDSLTSLVIIRQPEPATEPTPRAHGEPSKHETGAGPGMALTVGGGAS